MKPLAELYRAAIAAEEQIKTLQMRQSTLDRAVVPALARLSAEDVRQQIVDLEAVSRVYQWRHSAITSRICTLLQDEKKIAAAVVLDPSQAPALAQLRSELSALNREVADWEQAQSQEQAREHTRRRRNRRH